jgi:hypothetical protein
MKKTLKKFSANMSNSDFVDLIIQLDNIDNGNLCEDDDDYLCDFYDGLYKICKNQIDNNLNNNMFLVNRGETIGNFMNFLRMVSL